MNKLLGKLSVIIAVAFACNIAFADDTTTTAPAPNTVPIPMSATIGSAPTQTQNQNNQMMEKCKVVDSNGNGLIKPYMADSGINLAGDANAWIWVPYGQCSRINNGDFSGVSDQIRQKIDTSNIQMAPTLE